MEEKELPNGWLIAGYYIGIFSIFPLLGIIFGVIGPILAAIGLYISRKKQQKAGRWLGRIAIFVGVLGASLQLLMIYNVVYSV